MTKRGMPSFIALLLVCLVPVSCGPATTWTSEARSPVGLWLATARSQQWSGPGNDYDATTVYLKWVRGWRAPTEILVFSHQYATINLKMVWVTATHLNVMYGESGRPGDKVDLDFQVVKCGGVDISVQHIM